MGLEGTGVLFVKTIFIMFVVACRIGCSSYTGDSYEPEVLSFPPPFSWDSGMKSFIRTSNLLCFSHQSFEARRKRPVMRLCKEEAEVRVK